MRTPSSIKIASQVIVVWALMSGCSPDEPTVVVVVPEPLAPEPELAPEPRPAPGQIQAENGMREGVPVGTPVQVAVERTSQSSVSLSEVVPQTPRRLVFECTDGVTFAVRMNDNQLQLFPPGFPPSGFLGLSQVRSDSGVHYRAGDIDFRSKGEVATLEMGRERYVDCVANPAAAVWQESPLHNTQPR